MHKIDSADKLPNDFACQLADLGVIKLVGEQATSYLQGQVTANVENLTEDQYLLGCHCDFKGKTWNVFYVFGSATELYMLCHKECIPASLTELKKYGVFSKVEISDDSENWTVWGGAGQNIKGLSTELLGNIPDDGNSLVSAEGGFALNLSAPQDRLLLVVPSNQEEAVTAALSDVMYSPEVWELLDIQAGIANIQGETSNEFVPQMLNMQALDAIDFQKGCYMGQEVVARTKYLGKNKRASFILRSEQTADLAAGDTLEIQVGENWRRGGVIIRSINLQNQSWALAVLPNDSQPGDVLRNKAHPEQLFEVQALPYEIE